MLISLLEQTTPSREVNHSVRMVIVFNKADLLLSPPDDASTVEGSDIEEINHYYWNMFADLEERFPHVKFSSCATSCSAAVTTTSVIQRDPSGRRSVEQRNPNESIAPREVIGVQQLELLLRKNVVNMFKSISPYADGKDDDEGEENGGSVQEEDHALITRHRHRHHLQKCVEHIQRFLYLDLPVDAAAEELRCVICGRQTCIHFALPWHPRLHSVSCLAVVTHVS